MSAIDEKSLGLGCLYFTLMAIRVQRSEEEEHAELLLEMERVIWN